ncbi:hypothetical protein GDO81_005484 [Engystomops pustulosus]|uniref:Uncharacterized protein n=1 Tax=Engystomops pustulosus TaxID=76066 RepID=A0AAV7CPS9_ENGPU|nr:hypothetical protein GDO81_005484 [Engystomops pustulosus]
MRILKEIVATCFKVYGTDRNSHVHGFTFIYQFSVFFFCLCTVSTLMFGFVLQMGFVETLKLLLWIVFIDCIGVGLLIATSMWFISNKYLVKHQGRDYDVEWGYAFDVHLNAFYPLLVILHFIQLFFIKYVVLSDWFIGYFVGNTFWLIAIGYYIYITFLGYSGKLQVTFFFLSAIWSCKAPL